MNKNDPRVTNGWAMYDWANSVYPLVITSTIFPDLLQLPGGSGGGGAGRRAGGPIVEFFGVPVLASSLLIYAISAAFLIVAALSPLLTALADFSGRKKRFMQFFCYLGALSCAGLFFFTAANLSLAVLLYVLATVGFAGSLVFYNSYLPDIATEDRVDSLSAKGFSLGYIGSAILLRGLPRAGAGGVVARNRQRRGLAAFVSADGSVVGRIRADSLHAASPAIRGRPPGAAAAAGHGYLFNGYRQLARIWAELTATAGVEAVSAVVFLFLHGRADGDVRGHALRRRGVGDGAAGTDHHHSAPADGGRRRRACFFAKLSDAVGNISALVRGGHRLGRHLRRRLFCAGRAGASTCWPRASGSPWAASSRSPARRTPS